MHEFGWYYWYYTTGDDVNMIAWFVLMGIAITTFLLIAARRRTGR